MAVQHKDQKKRKAPPQGSDGRPKKQKTFDASKGSKAKAPLPKLSTKEKKEAVLAKKTKFKKNFGLIQAAVQLWEKLRPKTTSKEEKAQLAATILKQVHGHIVELANNHTASRVIQFCAKSSNEADRKKLMTEVRDNVVALAKSKYGHFLVQKLINVSTKEELPALIKLFKGHIPELLRHPHGCDVITDLYDVASTQQRNAMMAEFYGREFSLFGGVSQQGEDIAHLADLLSSAGPAKRKSVIQYFSKQLLPILEKALLHPPPTHRLVKEYLDNAPSSAVEDAIDTLSSTGGSVLKMVHTHEGAAAACSMLAYGSAKDRKRLVKAMKGYVREMAVNEFGNAVLCKALSCVDDTALLQKNILPEVKEHLEEICSNKNGRRVLLQLLAPDSHRHFPPHLLQMLHPPERTVKGGSGKTVTSIDGEEDDALEQGDAAGFDVDVGDDEGDDLFSSSKTKKQKKKHKKDAAADAAAAEPAGDDAAEDDGDAAGEDGVRVLGLSKKEPVQRRRELLGPAKGGLAAALLQLCAGSAGSMLRDQAACEVVVECCRGADDGLLQEVCQEQLEALHAAVVQEAGSSAAAQQGDDSKADAEPLLVSYFSSRALRRLVLASAADDASGKCAAAFTASLWRDVLAGRCKQWVGTHAEKVLAALLHCGDAAVKAAAAKELSKLVKGDVHSWAQAFVGQQHEASTGKKRKQQAQDAAGAAASKTPVGMQQQEAGSVDATPAAAGSKKQKVQTPAAGAAAGVTAAAKPVAPSSRKQKGHTPAAAAAPAAVSSKKQKAQTPAAKSTAKKSSKTPRS